jgi:hypothetical protein
MLALSLLSGLVFILLFTMLCTLPAWIAGKIVARKQPKRSFALTTPGRGHSLVRWTLLLIAGFAALSYFSTSTVFNTAQNYWPVVMAGVVSAGAAAAAQYLAFAIGHTSATTKLMKRQYAESLKESEEDSERAGDPADHANPVAQEPPAATQVLPTTPAFIAPPAAAKPAAPAGDSVIKPGIPGWT